MSSYLLDELTSDEIAHLIASGTKTVIVPLGATEQHGPALPLLVDSEHGKQTAVRAAALLGSTLVGPVITLGYSPEHIGFAGTISLSKETLANVLHDVAESLAKSGFELVYFWLAHGGNNVVLQEILPQLESKWPSCRVTGIQDLSSYVANVWDRIPEEEGVPLSVSGSHAGEFETSIMLACQPTLVKMERAAPGNLEPFFEISDAMFRDGIKSVSPNGVLGDQRAGDAARGEIYLNAMAKYLADDIRREWAS